jgi:hypothetical protein
MVRIGVIPIKLIVRSQFFLDLRFNATGPDIRPVLCVRLPNPPACCSGEADRALTSVNRERTREQFAGTSKPNWAAQARSAPITATATQRQPLDRANPHERTP